MLRFNLLFLITFPTLSTMSSQSMAGNYSGVYQGDPVRLTLKEGGDGRYSGVLDDSHNRYNVTAQGRGGELIGQAQESSLGLVFQLRGEFKGDLLAMKLGVMGVELPIDLYREGVEDKTVSEERVTSPVSGRQRDQVLVGSWTSQSNYNSGGFGQGSMSDESTLILLADGRVADGGSRTVVGGAGWSGSSGSAATGVLEGVYWYTENSRLYLQVVQNGRTEVQVLGKYYVENNHLLITADNGSKVLFYRS